MTGYGYPICPSCALPRPARLFDGFPTCELCRIKARVKKLEARAETIREQLELAEESYRASRACAGGEG